MRHTTLPTAADFARATAIRTGLIATGFLMLAAVAGLLLYDQSGVSIPFAAIIGAGAVLAVLAVMRWPIAGCYLLLFGTVLLEPFPVPGDPTSAYTWFFHANMSSWSPIKVAVSPLEILLGLTLVAWALRAGLDGRLSMPMGLLGRPVLAFGLCIVAGYVYGVGLSNGDNRIALWELRALVYAVVGYFLVSATFTSLRQVHVTSWIVVVGLVLNALRADWRYFSLGELAEEGDQGISGTAHENAMFLALLITFALLYLTFGRRGPLRWLSLISLPAVVFALLVSQRRAAFVVLFLGLIVWAVFLFLERRSLFLKIMPPLLVVGVVYAGVFWNHPDSTFGQPVRAIQTALGVGTVSARDQSSDLYRQVEEYNIWRTIRDNPLTGVGFGRPFTVYQPMIVMGHWEFQFYTPHNQVFWLWLKMGVVGFVLTLWLLAASVARLARLARTVDDPQVKPFLLMALAYVAMLLCFAYVDVGLANGRPMVLLGVLLGVAGKLPQLLEQPAGARAAVPQAVAPRVPWAPAMTLSKMR